MSSVLSSIEPSAGSIAQNAVLEKWRDLLTLILVLRASNSLLPNIPRLLKSMRGLQGISVWQEHQLLTLYQTLTALLLDKPVKEYTLFQLPNGACLLEVDGYSQNGKIPHPLF
ncbi:MAG TPA: hypothetical protein VGP47_03465, partial [Parachlamydiaceae bacterium]|nr:hypothetical protein [Parachlamydiaceae bacterium]